MRSLPLPSHWNTHNLGAPEVIFRDFVRLRPTVLYGHPFKTAMLLSLARERQIRQPLRIVATSGDELLPSLRAIVRDTCGFDPIDIYNCSEAGDIGWQCSERDRFHLNADQTYVEFLRNGHPVKDGEEGEVILTPLYRYAMPLIRYSPGDLATPGDGPCGCGLALPTLRALEGRTLNAVPLPGGLVFMGFTRLLSGFPGVKRFQVVQKALDLFHVSVVPESEGYSPEVLTRMTEAIHARLGREIRIEIRSASEAELVQQSRKAHAIIPLHTVDFGNVREA